MSGMRNSNAESFGGIRNSELESDFNRRTPMQRRWWKIPRRYQVALMCYLAFAIKGWMVTNLWTMFILIFVMSEEDRNHHFPTNHTWTIEDLETNLDMNYWGGAIVQIPAAALTVYLSPNRIMLLSILLSTVLHMIIPSVVHSPSGWMVFITFLHGMTAGPLASSCMAIWKEWAPLTERTSLLVLAFSGQWINLYVTYFLSMFLAETVGPLSIYYFAGIAGLIWCLLWNTLVYDSPSNDPLITVSELCYIEETIPPESKETISLRSIPVKSILTSMPVMSLCLVFFTISFLRKVMLLSGMLLNLELSLQNYDPSISHWILVANFVFLVPASAFLVDLLISKKKLPILVTRKIFCSGAFLLHVTFLFLTFFPDYVASVVCYSISFVFLSLSITGYIPNILEISPRYACFVIALCVTISSLSSVVFDYIVEAVQGANQSIEHETWRIVLIPCGILGLVAALVFAIFASSDEQPWSLTSLPSHRLRNDSKSYPRVDVEDDTLVPQVL